MYFKKNDSENPIVKHTPSDFFLSKKTQNRIENRLNYEKNNNNEQ